MTFVNIRNHHSFAERLESLSFARQISTRRFYWETFEKHASVLIRSDNKQVIHHTDVTAGRSPNCIIYLYTNVKGSKVNRGL